MGMVIEPEPRTYALILACASNARFQIGRLGTMRVQSGYYVYLGSALGPGLISKDVTFFAAPFAVERVILCACILFLGLPDEHPDRYSKRRSSCGCSPEALPR